MKRLLILEERIALRDLLAQCRGDFGMMLLAQKMEEDVLSKADAALFQIKSQGGIVAWRTVDDDGELLPGKPLPGDKEVDFGPEAESMLMLNLSRMSEAQQLTRGLAPLYRMFVYEVATANRDALGVAAASALKR